MAKAKRSNAAVVREEASHPPFETRELRKALSAFLSQEDPATGVRIGAYKVGVYAFFDYDGEPIYVGQTYEGVSSRIGRHLTGQRSDAVAKNVLDPFEVAEVEVWPLRQFQGRRGPHARTALNALEGAVFRAALKRSKFHAVLNEDTPRHQRRSKLPKSFRGPIVSPEVRQLRGHPDVRIARRASTLARLAQVVSERKVSIGLRRTLMVQAQRLEWLAEERLKYLER